MDMDHPSVVCVALPADESIAFEVVDHGRHIAAAFQNLLADLALGQRSQMVQSLQYGKLGIGEVANRVALCQAAHDRIGAARQLNEGVEGAHLGAGTSEMCGHTKPL